LAWQGEGTRIEEALFTKVFVPEVAHVTSFHILLDKAMQTATPNYRKQRHAVLPLRGTVLIERIYHWQVT
jgi:hypothetical protein